MEEIHPNNDHDLEFTRARVKGVGFINDGTCTWILRPSGGGATIASGTLTYVTGSKARYAGVIDADDITDSDLTIGSVYEIVISFTSPGGYDAELVLERIATRYTGD